MATDGLREAGFRLEDSTALITGAAGGLGSAIARGLARCGVRVALADLAGDQLFALREEIAGRGGDALAQPLDVTAAAEVSAAVHTVVGTWGQLDILVNCAGITFRQPAVEFSEEQWDRIIAINLKGAWLCCQAAGRVMIGQGHGRIINMASIGGLVGLPMSVAYCASKGGVVQMTRTLAVEWAPYGITVNAIAPCTFETPMVRRVMDAEEAYKDRVISHIPLGRMGRPEEIVGTVLYLASPASAMMTGHILALDGGYTAQ
ncbi:MAG TPA: SDR family NAD(P)-dependent oxidoreductase [Chloroflexota bacterium]|nr:SDR family NAD(P)-dependent oxidoreductase [Chloroflexota bacterium]